MLGLQRLLYGTLRPIEVEQLYEKSWFAITETCLAMTIFREEVGGWFLVMFVGLLAGKVWGWIGEGRVEILEQQPPANPRLFHARLSFSLLLSLVFDFWVLGFSIRTVLRQARPNMMVMFAFEFAVLSISSTSTAARYAISLYEAAIIKQQTKEKVEERKAEIRREREESRHRQEQEASAGTIADSHPTSSLDTTDEIEIDETEIDVVGWQNKGQWIFALELTTGESAQYCNGKRDLQLTSICRLPQACRVLGFLHYFAHILWPPHPYSPRRLPYFPVLLETY